MSALRVVSTGATMFVALLSARQLGPSGRGAFVLILGVASFALLIATLGVTTSGRIHLVSPEEPVPFGEYLGLACVLSVLQLAICVGLGVVLLPVVSVHLTLAEQALLGAYGGTLCLAWLLLGAVNAYGATVRGAAVDALGSVAQLVAVGMLVLTGEERVGRYIMAMTAGNLLQVAATLFVLRELGHASRARVRLASARLLVRTGLPGIAMDTAQVLTFKLDRYLIGAFMTPAAVGIYSVAATAPQLLRLPTQAVAQPIFHRLASGAAQVRDFARTRLICLALTGAMGAVVFAVAPVAVRVAFGPEYAAAVTPLRILLLAEFGMTVFFLDASSLAGGLRRVGDAATASFVGLAVVVAADVVLIPAYGIAGAAWASVVGYTITGLVAHLLLRRASRAVTAPPVDIPLAVDPPLSRG